MHHHSSSPARRNKAKSRLTGNSNNLTDKVDVQTEQQQQQQECERATSYKEARCEEEQSEPRDCGR
jgi:predicted HicB family RNase H-like nuclease